MPVVPIGGGKNCVQCGRYHIFGWEFSGRASKGGLFSNQCGKIQINVPSVILKVNKWV